MDYFELYKSRVHLNGNNYSESQRNKVKQNISKVFKKSPSYFEKEIIDLEGNITTKGIQIIDNNSLSKSTSTNQKNIVMQPNDKLELGYIIKGYNNSDWICIKKDSLIIEKGIIQECNIKLKWLCPIDKQTIHEVSAIQSNLSMYSIGTDESKYFISEDGKRMITVPMNVITKEIDVGYRFIIGNNVFRISEIYDGNYGIFEIKTEQVDKLPQDDFTNGIAYNGDSISQPPTSNSYTTQIIGDDNIQNGYSKTYQAKVYNNGIEVNENVLWSIDNSTIASITPNGSSCEVNGLLEGEYVILTCKLQSNNSILSIKSIYISGGW